MIKLARLLVVTAVLGLALNTGTRAAELPWSARKALEMAKAGYEVRPGIDFNFPPNYDIPYQPSAQREGRDPFFLPVCGNGSQSRRAKTD